MTEDERKFWRTHCLLPMEVVIDKNTQLEQLQKDLEAKEKMFAEISHAYHQLANQVTLLQVKISRVHTILEDMRMDDKVKAALAIIEETS